MSGITNFPTALDDDSSLHDVVDNTTPIVAAHHNNPKEAIKAIEARIGVVNSEVSSSLEYRLGSATDSHSHNGASGQGQPVAVSAEIRHMLSLNYRDNWFGQSAASQIAVFQAPRTMWLEAIAPMLAGGPTAATTSFDIKFGPSSIFGPTTNWLRHGPTLGRAFPTHPTTVQIVTVPSGAVVSADFIRSSASGDAFYNLDFTLVFRED